MSENQYSVPNYQDTFSSAERCYLPQTNEVICCLKKIRQELKRANCLMELELYIKWMDGVQHQHSVFGCSQKEILAMSRQLDLLGQKRKKSKSWLF